MTDAPETLETARLSGRPIHRGDTSHMHHILADRHCMRWLSADGQPATTERVHKIAVRLSSHWETHGFGPRLFFLREGGAFAGWCGLRHQMVNGRSEIELLYSLRHSLWRRGLAREMARAAIDEGIETLGIRRIVAVTLPDNVASQGVMKASGLEYWGDTVYADLPHRMFGREW